MSEQPTRFTASQMKAALAAIAKLPKKSAASKTPMSKQERSVVSTAAGFLAAARRAAADVESAPAERTATIAECVKHANIVRATLNLEPVKVSDYPLAKSPVKTPRKTRKTATSTEATTPEATSTESAA